MKFIIYLPLLTSALLLGWYLSSGNEAPTPAPAPAVTAQDSRISAPPSLPPPSAPARLTPAAQEPTSLRGTQVDGELLVDARGNLVLTSQVRHLFDYFLSLIGEESSQQARQRIRDHLTAQLDEPARGQALELLETYLDYQYQLVDLEARFPVAEHLEDLLAREQAVQQLRARLFSREAHEAFFAGEEIYNNFTLERLTIQQDPSLSDREKGLAIEALRENLPEEMQQLLVPQIHNDLREQTLALRAAGADEGRIRQLRMGMLGPEATERLEELDRSRAEWRERVAAFQQERERILSQPGLAESDRRAAVNALLEEQFTANERLRLIN
ncbi:Lipase chaperone LimK [Halopseudomonas formosensis]|uniref:Lipase chaperone n=1 Tax=Halopseudomonas formosensis TaxID=1002526 RepID=A0A1I6BQL8_9GAMM|nr:lipase secretion chaperone [Halopseudomonas formosensis]SFQ83230.1 Lipase chaperone LimK [Halopseudomonas formosensis]